jgi:SAM-dependent methyltransferase
MKGFLRKVFPASVRRRVVRATRRPQVGRTDLGDLRRLDPVSRAWGSDRGTPIDRYYIEQFLKSCETDIAGHVLEIGTDMYTRAFGQERVERSDVLHVSERNEGVTIVADLTRGQELPRDTFDCVILTQTLQFIFDVEAALASVRRALKPGGIVLATVPGISRISRHDMDRWGDYWRFTTLSVRKLFENAFPDGPVEVGSTGNVLSSIAFLHGLAAEELDSAELDHPDPNYELLITIRARKGAEAG